jgi:hypothetical protein
MPGSLGSSLTSRTPRAEHGVPFPATAAMGAQPARVAAPLWISVQVAPPSVDLYRPHGPAPGIAIVTAPPQQTDELPSSARPSAA